MRLETELSALTITSPDNVIQKPYHTVASIKYSIKLPSPHEARRIDAN
jgi:hypothetical protein